MGIECRDCQRRELEPFYEEMLGRDWWTASEALGLLAPENIPLGLNKNSAKSLGRYLMWHRDKALGNGLVLRSWANPSRSTYWRVERQESVLDLL